jgi:hypothetical protein
LLDDFNESRVAAFVKASWIITMINGAQKEKASTFYAK